MERRSIKLWIFELAEIEYSGH